MELISHQNERLQELFIDYYIGNRGELDAYAERKTFIIEKIIPFLNEIGIDNLDRLDWDLVSPATLKVFCLEFFAIDISKLIKNNTVIIKILSSITPTNELRKAFNTECHYSNWTFLIKCAIRREASPYLIRILLERLGLDASFRGVDHGVKNKLQNCFTVIICYIIRSANNDRERKWLPQAFKKLSTMIRYCKYHLDDKKTDIVGEHAVNNLVKILSQDRDFQNKTFMDYLNSEKFLDVIYFSPSLINNNSINDIEQEIDQSFKDFIKELNKIRILKKLNKFE